MAVILELFFSCQKFNKPLTSILGCEIEGGIQSLLLMPKMEMDLQARGVSRSSSEDLDLFWGTFLHAVGHTRPFQEAHPRAEDLRYRTLRNSWTFLSWLSGSSPGPIPRPIPS